MSHEPHNAEAANAEPPKKRAGAKKGQRGAPRGNDNAARHYLKAGKLPPTMAYIEKRVNAFRRHLEDAVGKAKGEVSIVDAAAINSALKWERHGILCQHYLRHNEETLSVDQFLKYSEAMA